MAAWFRRLALFAWPQDRLILATLLALSLVVPAGIIQSASAAAPSAEQKIGPGVLAALRAAGSARVVIALTEPLSLKAPSKNLAAVRRDIAALQQTVLSAVTPADFRPKRRYQAVPALSGVLQTESGLRKLAAQPNVVKIDLDEGGAGALATSVPLIGADTWHAHGITGTGVVVAVLDSGLDTDHADFAGALIAEECFLDDGGTIDGHGYCPNGSDRQSGPGAAEDDAGHGTHVTGIVASRGNRSSVGVAPGTKIVAIKVTTGPSFSGVFFALSEVVAGLDFIIANRPDVQVINMSLVTNASYTGDCDTANAATMAGASAINTLRARGTIAFASSGNTGSGTQMTWPACLKNVVSVGATDNKDQVASFTASNAATDLMAPGVNIVSSGLSNGTATASGTSMASPHAAGCAALLIQAHEAETPDQIEAWMEASPIRVTDPTNGLSFPRLECRSHALSTLAIAGPAAGIANASYAFTATAGSSSALTPLTPLTYTWQADGQAPIVASGGLSNTVSFAWNTPGTKVITVTAANSEATVTTTHTILINAATSRNYLPSMAR